MAVNSINTNVGAYFAQSNIGKASNMASSSIARLSSGDRIVRAADDVAAMSAGTSLRTNVTTLRMALVNTSQGASMLQVADGALGQITDILQRQKAIAVQSGAGSLSDAERSFLNQEFQNLTEEIDRLASQTNFNGVTLLDGSLSERVDVTDEQTSATSATASIAFSTNPAAAETLILNGVTFTAVAAAATPTATQFNIGLTMQETVDNLVTQLNASTDVAISQATYSREGTSLVITADNGGSQGGTYTIDADTSTAINGTGTGVGAINGGDATIVQRLFDDAPAAQGLITVASIDTVVTAAAAAQNTPFQIGEMLTVDLGGGAGAQNLMSANFAATDTLESIVNDINSRTNIHGVTAHIIGSSGAYNLQFETTALTTDSTYNAANATDITIAGAAATVALASYGFEAAANTVNQFNFNLNGGDDLGIGAGDTVGVGTSGNNIITDQNQQQAEISIIFPEIADADLISATNFGQAAPSSITIGGATGVTFQFSSNSGGLAATEAAVGATLEETLDNMVATINAYDGIGEADYALNQIEAFRDGTSIKIRTLDAGNATTVAAATLQVTSANLPASATVTNTGNLSNGQTDGVTTSGVTNSDFVGIISGFSATYGGTANTTDLSITVGNSTYVAQNVTTNPTADTTVRFSSQDGGGYFDVEFAANNGEVVNTQADADAVASRLDAAFSSITFYQEREVSSYTGNDPIVTDGVVTGSLIGTSVSMRQDDFSSTTIDSIRVSAPQGSSENASITITIDGVAYNSASNISDQLGANQSYRFISEDNAEEYIEFTTGGTVIELDTDAKAAAFEEALGAAFGVGNGDAEIQFQVGVTTTDTLRVGISNVSTDALYNGASLDILTQETAAAASDAIDAAIDAVTAVRAEVGALQSRFDFAAANVESSIQNQDAARAVLLDTDIASESTAYSTAQVQLQAGISVLAQANLLPQNLLKLIG